MVYVVLCISDFNHKRIVFRSRNNFIGLRYMHSYTAKGIPLQNF